MVFLDRKAEFEMAGAETRWNKIKKNVADLPGEIRKNLAELRDELIRGFWPVVWDAIALVLVAMAILYFLARLTINWGEASAYMGAIIVLLILMFFAEGTEIAVTSLKDKDPDQIRNLKLRSIILRLTGSDMPASHPQREHRARTEQRAFITGRQMITVGSVVGLAAFCGLLSGLPDTPSDKALLPPYLLNSKVNWVWTYLSSQVARGLFTFFFPTFIALWYAQIVSKFLATDNPLAIAGLGPSLAIIEVSAALGRLLRLGAPSEFPMRFWKGGVVEKFRPSRADFYTSLATLRDGKGLEEGQIAITVRSDGSVSVTERFRYRVYAKGFGWHRQRETWRAQVLANTADFKIVQWPGKFEMPNPEGPFLDDKDDLEDLKSEGDEHSIRWELVFGEDLPIGGVFEYQVSYETESAACRYLVGQEECYYYYFTDCPAASLDFSIQAAPDAPFRIVKREVYGPKDAAEEAKKPVRVRASNNGVVNSEQASLVETSPIHKGCVFHVKYPLVGSKYWFYWRIVSAGGHAPA